MIIILISKRKQRIFV